MESRPGYAGPSSQGDFEPFGSPTNRQRPPTRRRKLSRMEMLDGKAADSGIYIQKRFHFPRNYDSASVQPTLGTSKLKFGVARPTPPPQSPSHASEENWTTSRLYCPPQSTPPPHFGQTEKKFGSTEFVPWDPKVVVGLKRVETMKEEEEPIVDVSPYLTFRKYFSFNHPVYAAKLQIRNKSEGIIAYKIIPSNVKKLVMVEKDGQGIIDRGTTKEVSIMTHSMIPYNYVDIRREVIDVAFAPVELYNVETQKGIKNQHHSRWDKVAPKALENFWKCHPPGKNGTGMTRIVDLRASDSAFLTEKSVMWAEWGPFQFVKSIGRCVHNPMTGWGDGIADFVHCDFEEEKRFVWNCLAKMFPRHMDLDTTEWLADESRKYTTLTLKKKIVKFLILSVGTSLCVTFIPLFPEVWKWVTTFPNQPWKM